ncbi:MAG: hypothetical protein NTW98_02035 [Candidatus Nomurabacteria bacterium]|nr:hypothetical protein [Candidatus Nomurabacteria bacterium]
MLLVVTIIGASLAFLLIQKSNDVYEFSNKPKNETGFVATKANEFVFDPQDTLLLTEIEKPTQKEIEVNKIAEGLPCEEMPDEAGHVYLNRCAEEVSNYVSQENFASYEEVLKELDDTIHQNKKTPVLIKKTIDNLLNQQSKLGHIKCELDNMVGGGGGAGTGTDGFVEICINSANQLPFGLLSVMQNRFSGSKSDLSIFDEPIILPNMEDYSYLNECVKQTDIASKEYLYCAIKKYSLLEQEVSSKYQNFQNMLLILDKKEPENFPDGVVLTAFSRMSDYYKVWEERKPSYCELVAKLEDNNDIVLYTYQKCLINEDLKFVSYLEESLDILMNMN